MKPTPSIPPRGKKGGAQDGGASSKRGQLSEKDKEETIAKMKSNVAWYVLTFIM